MNYLKRVKQDAKMASDNAEEIRVLSEIADFYERTPECVDCDANTSLIRKYFQGAEITADALDTAFSHTGLYQSLAKGTLQESRQKVEERILALLAQSSPGTAAHEQAKFRYMSTEELEEKLDALETKREMQQKTPAELKAILQAARPVQETELPPEITRAAILGLWTPEQFRWWARKLGSFEPITRRINERK